VKFEIVIGWWIIPAIITLLLIYWCLKQDYGGSYNFNAVFFFPATGFGISLVWLIYTAIGWALS